MSRRVRVPARPGLCLCTAAAVLLGVSAVAPAAKAGIITAAATQPVPVTQTATLPLTTTDFNSGSNIPGNPLVFQRFNDQQGTRHLDSVSLTVHATIQNQFTIRFDTPATITDSVASGKPELPGPSITVFQPDGKTALLSAGAPNDPAQLSRSVTYGFTPGQAMGQVFSSTLPSSSPYYIAPTNFNQTKTLTLTAPADLALFSGDGSLSLPVTATAWSSFFSNSGNGFGKVTTNGSADVTVNYNWSPVIPAPQVVPEPAAVVLWGLGSALVALRFRSRRWA